MKFQEEFITLFKCFYLNKLINQIYILNLIKICTKFLLFYIPNSTKFTIMIWELVPLPFEYFAIE
jgi:hypothetical protein